MPRNVSEVRAEIDRTLNEQNKNTEVQRYASVLPLAFEIMDKTLIDRSIEALKSATHQFSYFLDVSISIDPLSVVYHICDILLDNNFKKVIDIHLKEDILELIHIYFEYGLLIYAHDNKIITEKDKLHYLDVFKRFKQTLPDDFVSKALQYHIDCAEAALTGFSTAQTTKREILSIAKLHSEIPADSIVPWYNDVLIATHDFYKTFLSKMTALDDVNLKDSMVAAFLEWTSLFVRSKYENDWHLSYTYQRQLFYLACQTPAAKSYMLMLTILVYHCVNSNFSAEIVDHQSNSVVKISCVNNEWAITPEKELETITQKSSLTQSKENGLEINHENEVITLKLSTVNTTVYSWPLYNNSNDQSSTTTVDFFPLSLKEKALIIYFIQSMKQISGYLQPLIYNNSRHNFKYDYGMIKGLAELYNNFLFMQESFFLKREMLSSIAHHYSNIYKNDIDNFLENERSNQQPTGISMNDLSHGIHVETLITSHDRLENNEHKIPSVTELQNGQENILHLQVAIREELDETEKKLDSLNKLTTEQNLKEIRDLTKKLNELKHELEPILEKYREKEVLKRTIASFDQHPNREEFYSHLQTCLNQLFLAYSVIATGKVSPGANTFSHITDGITLLGEVVACVPGAGEVPKMLAGFVSFGFNELNEKRQINDAKYISNLCTRKQFEREVEITANILCDSYQDQLDKLPRPEELEETEHKKNKKENPFKKITYIIKRKVGKEIHEITKKKSQSIAQYLAEYAAYKIGLLLESTTFTNNHNLHEKFVSVVTNEPPSFLNLKERLIENFGSGTFEIKHDVSWNLFDIFIKTGLIVPETGVKYVNGKTNATLYGFRRGTACEAAHIAGMRVLFDVPNYHLSATPAKSITQFSSVLQSTDAQGHNAPQPQALPVDDQKEKGSPENNFA